MNTLVRWILAFDGSCCACRTISATVASVCGEKLEVLPLQHPDVEKMRKKLFDPEPKFSPTLLKVYDDSVKGWTRPMLALKLFEILGFKDPIKVLKELGRLKLEGVEPEINTPYRSLPMDRRGFTMLAAGAVAAGAIMFTGVAPAFADDTGICKQSSHRRILSAISLGYEPY